MKFLEILICLFVIKIKLNNCQDVNIRVQQGNVIGVSHFFDLKIHLSLKSSFPVENIPRSISNANFRISRHSIR